MLRSMVLAIRQTLILWSEAMNLHPEAHQSCGIAGAGYQRNLDNPLPGEYDHHVLTAESVADFTIPALVVIAAQFARP